MNSFDGFVLSGANKSRYVPIFGNSAGIIGAYRKAMGAKVINRVKTYGKIELGLVPLFLLDGDLSMPRLKSAVDKLGLKAYVAIYRPYDVKLKTRYEEHFSRMRSWAFIKKDGSVAEWVLEDKQRAESIKDEYTGERLRAVQPYLDYEKAKQEYDAAVSTPPVAAGGYVITGDLNTFLYEWAKAMFPFGVESILETNTKQSAIVKHSYFMDGFDNAPTPKGVKQGGGQLALFEADRVNVYDAIEMLQRFFALRLEQNGFVKLNDIIIHCADMGFYKSSLTLYVIGAAFREFDREDAVCYDGVCCFRYSEVRDISSWFIKAYDEYRRRDLSSWRAALFIDDTGLKRRLEYIFDVEPSRNNQFDTLCTTIVRIGAWIVENLRYPIAFLDNTIYRMFRENCLHGEELRQYDAYFNQERCDWLKANIPRADAMARQAIRERVGFDPDTIPHGMSNLPKGHYAPVLYSADDYIDALMEPFTLPEKYERLFGVRYTMQGVVKV